MNIEKHLFNRRELTVIFLDMHPSMTSPETVGERTLTRWEVVRQALGAFLHTKCAVAPRPADAFVAIYGVWEECVELLPPTQLAATTTLQSAISSLLARRMDFSGDVHSSDTLLCAEDKAKTAAGVADEVAGAAAATDAATAGGDGGGIAGASPSSASTSPPPQVSPAAASAATFPFRSVSETLLSCRAASADSPGVAVHGIVLLSRPTLPPSGGAALDPFPAAETAGPSTPLVKSNSISEATSPPGPRGSPSPGASPNKPRLTASAPPGAHGASSLAAAAKVVVVAASSPYAGDGSVWMDVVCVGGRAALEQPLTPREVALQRGRPAVASGSVDAAAEVLCPCTVIDPCDFTGVASRALAAGPALGKLAVLHEGRGDAYMRRPVHVVDIGQLPHPPAMTAEEAPPQAQRGATPADRGGRNATSVSPAMRAPSQKSGGRAKSQPPTSVSSSSPLPSPALGHVKPYAYERPSQAADGDSGGGGAKNTAGTLGNKSAGGVRGALATNGASLHAPEGPRQNFVRGVPATTAAASAANTSVGNGADSATADTTIIVNGETIDLGSHTPEPAPRRASNKSGTGSAAGGGGGGSSVYKGRRVGSGNAGRNTSANSRRHNSSSGASSPNSVASGTATPSFAARSGPGSRRSSGGPQRSQPASSIAGPDRSVAIDASPDESHLSPLPANALGGRQHPPSAMGASRASTRSSGTATGLLSPPYPPSQSPGLLSPNSQATTMSFDSRGDGASGSPGQRGSLPSSNVGPPHAHINRKLKGK